MSKAQGYEINTLKLGCSPSVYQCSALVRAVACVCPLVVKIMNCRPEKVLISSSKYIDQSKRQQKITFDGHFEGADLRLIM